MDVEGGSTAADVEGGSTTLDVECGSTTADVDVGLRTSLHNKLLTADEAESLSPYEGSPLNFTLIAAAYCCIIGVISNDTLGGLLGGRKFPPVAITIDLEYCTNLDKPQRMLCRRSFRTFAVRCCATDSENETN